MVKTIDRVRKVRESIRLQRIAIEYNQKTIASSGYATYEDGRIFAYKDVEERLMRLIGQLPGG
jgi:hypothetical protein